MYEPEGTFTENAPSAAVVLIRVPDPPEIVSVPGNSLGATPGGPPTASSFPVNVPEAATLCSELPHALVNSRLRTITTAVGLTLLYDAVNCRPVPTFA